MRAAYSAAMISLLALWSGAGRADGTVQAFSADIIKRNAEGAVIGAPAKLRASDLKTRIDTPEAAGGFFLTDAAAGTAVFVLPAKHLYMDAAQSTPLTRIFVRLDPRDPCPRWRAAAITAGMADAENWRCETVREAAIIDPFLQFPIKWRSPDGVTIALENIRREIQPTELFAVPAGCQKLDPRGLVERIKHSDVWAPPPDGR